MKTSTTGRALVMTLLFLATASPSFAGGALGVKVSSLGLGAEFTGSLTNKVNLRLGGNFFGRSYAGTKDDIDYDFDLHLRSVTGMVDLYPLGSVFHLTGGLVANRNALDAIGTSTLTYSIGNSTYTKGQVGTLSGRVDFKKTAPYAGIGFGNAVARDKHVTFGLDLGIVFQGSPNVVLTATGPAASNAQFQNDLRIEQQNLQDDLKLFKYYPVIALGVSFKF